MTRREQVLLSRGGSNRDPYQGVVISLLALSLLGATSAFYGGVALADRVLLDAAVTLGLSTGVLIGVALIQTARARKRATGTEAPASLPAAQAEAPTSVPGSVGDRSAPSPRQTGTGAAIRERFFDHEGVKQVGTRTGRGMARRVGGAGVLAIGIVLVTDLGATQPAPALAAIAAALCLGAAGLAATAARYFADLDPARFPEAPGLCRGARVVAWVLVLAALSTGLVWAGRSMLLEVPHLVALGINAAGCYGLLVAAPAYDRGMEVFPLDLGVLSLLGTRANILASVLDAAERQLGIDLRSTWALTVVRRSAEPLAIGLLLLAWLSTSLTVVRVDEQGLVERFGVPSAGETLGPGLHLHWPWPIERVFRIPVQHIQSLTVGHEGAEEGGPENVLWARQHAANEYTLLLGNGRDLIAVDAALQFRITDAHAWYYECQNPADALRAIAYRAVMRSTVNRTLDEALSENLVALTARMRAMIQQDADALGLGVHVVTFTVGGMHPPVPVAPDYQAVVSAELGKVTAAVNAQVFRNEALPAAEAAVIANVDAARAEGAEAVGRAQGEAWSFRALEAQYQTAPEEYRFRRRLETLENRLAGRHFTVVDSRIQKDGGELWLLP